MNKLEVGDVVVLRGTLDPRMVVQEVNQYSTDGGKYAKCAWFTGSHPNQVVETFEFAIAGLIALEVE